MQSPLLNSKDLEKKDMCFSKLLNQKKFKTCLVKRIYRDVCEQVDTAMVDIFHVRCIYIVNEMINDFKGF